MVKLVPGSVMEGKKQAKVSRIISLDLKSKRKVTFRFPHKLSKQ
jgi:hypothetical protein